ncbi:MAG: hypothetical protein PHC68_13090 [Syntrophorhabdaceae bacterium]|jgi:hypothetical protein|nr:hypothetical protein [Syntrophorhabdaceae bacterium]
MTKILWSTFVILLIILILAVIVTRLPSNESLIGEFQTNKETYKVLRNMYFNDQNLYVLGRYNTGKTYIKYYDDRRDRLSSIQENQYFKLLEKSGIDGIGDWGMKEVDRKDKIFFNVAHSGWAGGGRVKRIVWLKQKPEQLQIRRDTATIKLYPIEDNWYLSEEHYP